MKLVDKTEKRREQCRRNQARYRVKQSQYVLSLQEEVAKLQRQIPRLERERDAWMLSSATRSTAWGVAVEYFRLFRHGDKAPKLLHQFAPESNVQRDFLRATMSPDATDGDVIGVNALMAKWRFYSLSHGDFYINLERVERGSHNCIIATITTNMTITEDSILHTFPHLLKDHVGRSLSSRLLGRHFSMRGSVRFDWDEASGRVRRLTRSSDLMTPILNILGSLEAVVLVFSQARITLDDNVARHG